MWPAVDRLAFRSARISWDQGRQDNALAFILKVQKCVVKRTYKPVLPGFAGQRSLCFLAKLPTQEYDKRKKNYKQSGMVRRGKEQ